MHVSPALVVLSAKNEVRLRERVAQLLEAIETYPLTDAHLADMAYTLQVGREAMEIRLGFLADDMADAKRKLEAYLAGEEGIEDLHRGEMKQDKELTRLVADEDMARAIETWVAKGKYGKLLELWVKGLPFDWNRLYGEAKPRRIGLPAYPFAKERYWVTDGTGKAIPAPAPDRVLTGAGRLHPLVHRNTSNYWGQRFSSSFSGDEFFLADHRVGDRCVLPGVAYLELARAAIEHCMDGVEDVRLEDVVWLRPLVLDEAELAVHIGLYPEDDGSIGYEIYDGVEEESGEPLIHGRGRAVLESPGERPALDPEAIQARCHEREEWGEALYSRFSRRGIDYGPAHRGLERLTLGRDAAGLPQVLARVGLPESVTKAGDDGYGLHPSLMDAALQAVAGMSLEAESGETLVPFALDEVRIWSNTPQRGWVWVRFSETVSTADMGGKFDIDLCDDEGRVCVRLAGLSVRALEGVQENTDRESAGALKSGLIMLAPVWDAVEPWQGETSPASGDRTLVIGGTPQRRAALLEHLSQAVTLELPAGTGVEAIKQQLEQLGEIDHIFWLAPQTATASLGDDALVEVQEQGVLQCFHLFKALAALGYDSQPLSWTLITIQTQAIRQADEVFPAHASVHGFAGSLAKEYPHWQMRLVDLPAGEDWPLEALLRLPADPEGAGWSFRDGEWYRQHLLPGRLPEAVKTGYRQGGVYLVIGGAGGIGEVWSEYMIHRYGARIVWIGRRAPDAVIEAKLERLARLGPRPLYLSADASDRQALEAAYNSVRERYGEVHGVIHSAIVLEDKSLNQMSEASFRAVLAAKVDVSVRLAQVFGGEPLDFVLFFSSLQSFMPAPGQSNYAAGCAFKDAFAQALGRQGSFPVRIMNWGYWGGTGVVATPEYRARMASLGIGSIEPEEGMTALEVLLVGFQNQLGLMKSTQKEI
jgi:acyl transferase domain-containing protein